MPLSKKDLFFGFAKKMTQEQYEYVNSIMDNMVTVVPSVAGTGKTTLAVAAAKYLQRDLIWVFPNIGESEFGHMPGTLWDKQLQYLGPLFDALDEIRESPSKCVYREDVSPENKKEVMQNLKNGDIWVYPKPHSFLRGTNLKGNKIVFIDEAQNFTKLQLKKIITRVHDDVKLVIAGHTGQCDLKNSFESGFQDYIDFYRTKDYAKVIELNNCYRGIIASDADKV